MYKYLCALCLCFILFSCQKEADWANPNPNPPEPPVTIDSTLLIKSIKWVTPYYDDYVWTEFYHYDTANRKVIIAMTEENLDPADNRSGTQIILSYNEKGLLIKSEWKYPPSFVKREFDYSTINIEYDNDGVLAKMSSDYFSANFIKKAIQGGGYTLQREDVNGGGEYMLATFNSNDVNIATEVIDISSGYMKKDSVVFDAAGNVQKLILRESFNNNDEAYTAWEFLSRETKGDQLYEHRQKLFNGIAHLLSGEHSFLLGGAFGLLSETMESEELQYQKYPFTTVRINFPHYGIEEFTVKPEIDEKGRLKKAYGFMVDIDILQWYHEIEYFK